MKLKPKSPNKNLLCTAAAAVLMASAMTSCGVYTQYSTPTDTPLTKAYADARAAMDEQPDSMLLGNLTWERMFTDPVLTDLISRALADNSSLKDAHINTQIAQAQLQGAKLAYLPGVAVAPSVQYSKVGEASGTVYQIPVSASWEVDLFGKLLNSKRSAQVAVERSEAYAQAVRSQLIASVANTYYAMSAVEAQLALSRSTARLWQQSVETMRALKEAGRLTEAAVVQSDANYRSVLASITDLEVKRHELDNTMSLLLNAMPQHYEVSADAVLQLPAELDNGVPMQYLAMRPDVTAAERAMASAYYATNSARAAFYPGLNIPLTGGWGKLAAQTPADWFVTLGASLTAPLFQRGQNIARLKAAQLAQQQSLNAFERTLLSAAGEVSNALTVYAKADERAEHIAQQVADLEKALTYTNDLLVYSNGTYLEVLTAQQSLLSAQLNRINTALTRSQAAVSLYQAMGGGR